MSVSEKAIMVMDCIYRFGQDVGCGVLAFLFGTVLGAYIWQFFA